MKRNYPLVDVDPDPIFVRDGNVYTSAGVTAGIDLALALVEEDLGRAAARDVARALVLFIRRPGGQAQFSAGLAGQAAAQPGVREVQAWIADHLESDLSVPALAERAFMSPRNFARVFAREVGMTPAAYVEALRVERARTLLETTEHAARGDRAPVRVRDRRDGQARVRAAVACQPERLPRAVRGARGARGARG